MNKLNHLLRAALLALTAALMAGCVATLALSAPGFDFARLPVYLVALAAAALLALARRGTAWAIASAALLLAGLGALLAAELGGIAALFRQLADGAMDASRLAEHAGAAYGLALILALILGALFTGLLRRSSGAPFAIMILLASTICALAMNEALSLWLALPGFAAGAVAFALPREGAREGVRPALALPALVLAVAAILLAPGQRLTWEPMARLAERVRAVVQDYIHFTEQRVAFSINEKGYDRAGMLGEDVVAMLGGPANPTRDSVMRVQTDTDLLLRGTIKRSYTGYSWVDDQPKARYLYYDFTHRGVRDEVFGANGTDDDGAFQSVRARVEMLAGGTSTLFVPAHLSEFSMDLANAVYYNSTGEMFLTRDTAAGDRYELTARVPLSAQALIEAARAAADEGDARYEAALADYTALPEGIDARVYALAEQLSGGAATAAEKAFAIQNYLAQNFRYTLDGGYPDLAQDFVSWFLLEARQGYCSYFASAMTVLCRIAGLPARYVEGYAVKAGGGETIVTGEDAHAWVEVYLSGLGWTAFDPTARARQMQGGSSEGGQSAPNPDSGLDADGQTPFENDDVADNPTPSPTPDAGDNSDAGSDPTPDAGDNSDAGSDPTPDAGDNSDALSDPTPDSGDNSDANGDPPEPDSGPDGAPDAPDGDASQSRAWLWILLAVLALAALGALWLARRLRQSDPVRLCARTRSSQTAALILYRAMLSLLSLQGQTPAGGETPEAFAERAAAALSNPDYPVFVAAVARSSYGGGLPGRDAVETGLRAYRVFLGGMRRVDRLRFALRRALRGIGDIAQIP